MENILLFKHIFFMTPFLGLSLSDVKLSGEKEKEFGLVHNWPKYNLFGQISAVGIDNSGNVYVFHRGSRRWDSSTFSVNNIFNDKDKGPIPNETIVVLENNEGSLLKKTGAHTFYLPHGLTIDDDNNLWVTDVALHQVFKFPPIDFKKELEGLGDAKLTLGVSFEPGSDNRHFCKPTGVAVDKETKEFYVSDGYCNSRIIKYDQFGNVLLTLGRTSIGSPKFDFYMLKVPHDLALAQDKQTIYVADRENLRVVSYNFQSGKFMRSYAEELKSRIFSVAHSPLQGGLLFVLTNDNAGLKMVALYKEKTGKRVLSFSPKTNFTNPHDLAISHDGKYYYVVELGPFKVWKFELDMTTVFQTDEQTFSVEKKSEKQINYMQEPLLSQSKVDGITNVEVSSSFLAASLVVSVIIISFLTFMLHYYKRKGGFRRHETRRLILDDDESGIRLT